MSDPNALLGRAFLQLAIWRALRGTVYAIVGIFRPGWRHAGRAQLALDRYADRSTMNLPVYSDPRYLENVRALEAELRRLRRGGAPTDFELPYDFPPGAQKTTRELMT